MPGLPGHKGAQPISPGLGGTGPREIDQPTRRIDALRLVVRDLGEQLPRTDLPPEASAMVWRRLQDLYLEVFAISTVFIPWARQ